MFRKAFVAAAVLVFLELFTASSSSARVISQRNPYRSYNISGINYGSMQWERTNRSQSTYRFRSTRSWFRRR